MDLPTPEERAEGLGGSSAKPPKRPPLKQPEFLPMSRAELAALGWSEPDVLLVSGDAYVDHPSFGVALLGRWLVEHGYRVAILAQPRWEGAGAEEDFTSLPRPRLFAGVTAGAIDSMLAHHTAFRKKRRDDAYTPGGKSGSRPNRASIVYTGLLRRFFPGLPVVLGGLEASLRRISHYDFWTDSLRRSILLDSKADLLLCGMAEQSLLEAARVAERVMSEAVATSGLEPEAGNGSSGNSGKPRKPAELQRKKLARAWSRLPGAVTAWNPRELAEFWGVAPAGGDNPACGGAGTVTPETEPGALEEAPLAASFAAPSNTPFATQVVNTRGSATAAAYAADASSLSDDESCSRLIILPSHEEILADPFKLLSATLELERAVHQGCAFLRQDAGERSLLLAPFSQFNAEDKAAQGRMLDKLYSLPFSRLPHPSCREPVPAWEMIRTSITTHRGCGGGCSFCSLALHQGRRLSSRSRESVLAEARLIAAGPQKQAAGRKSGGKPQPLKPPKWAGSISDVGGPSANMWQGNCAFDPARCARSSCLFPKPCPGFKVDQRLAVSLLREVAAQPGVRHVRVASGVRFDMAVRDAEAMRAYTMDFTGGQLKVAPEHISEAVLRYMRKPSLEVFQEFLESFAKYSRKAGKEQYVIPYLISAFPGCTEAHMRELKNWLKKRGWSPKQVQCFIPTPGTVATAMYYCERDPDGKKIPVAKSDRDRLRQHHILLD